MSVATDNISLQVTVSPGTPLQESEPITVPEKSLGEWGIALLLFAISVLYLRLFYNYTILYIDEGIILQGAQRILQGQVPYRDFFSYFTPGSYYWMAALFKVFGSSILVARAALMVYGGVFSSVTYLLARRVCSRWNAGLAALPTLIVCLPYRFVALHSWDSTLWALLALYCAVRWLEACSVNSVSSVVKSIYHGDHRGHGEHREKQIGSSAWKWAFATGSLLAMTVLFEQSKGAGLALGLALGFFGLKLCAPSSVRLDRKTVAALALGFTAPFLLTVAYFALHRSAPQMIADLLWPFQHYSSANKLPYGYVVVIWRMLVRGSLGSRALGVFILSPLLVLSALPIFALPVAAYSALRLRKSREASGACRYYLLVSAALFGVLLSTIATGRPDALHIVFEAPLFCLVLGWMAEAAKTPFLRAARTLGVSYVLVSFGTLGGALLFGPLTAKYRLETRRGMLRAPAPYGAFQYIQSRIKPGEKILVYPYQPLFYYLTATYNVSRYEYLFPGMNTPSQFEDMAREFKASRPRAALFNPCFSDSVARVCPNVSLKALAATDPVTGYLASHYRACRSFDGPGLQWDLVFMVRKDLPCIGEASATEHTQSTEKKAE